jgi:uncharacterized repeat protein (TIGR01451 family)
VLIAVSFSSKSYAARDNTARVAVETRKSRPLRGFDSLADLTKAPWRWRALMRAVTRRLLENVKRFGPKGRMMRMRRRFAPRLEILAAGVLSVAGAGMAAPASAGINTWTYAGPDGGRIVKVIYNPRSPTTLYLGAQSGFYRSTDSGASWSLIDGTLNGAPTDLEIDPSNPDRLYVGTQGSAPALWMSNDGGATLAPVTSYPQSDAAAHAIAVSADGATVFAADGSSLLRSQDRGQTWQGRTTVATNGGAVFKLLISPADANTLVAMALTSGAGLQLFVTHDGAATWQFVGGSSPLTAIEDVAFSATNPNKLWEAGANGAAMSSDQGVTWTQTALVTPLSTIVVDSADSATAYAGTADGRLFRTADQGATWTEITSNLTVGFVRTIAINPAQRSVLMVGGNNGLSATTTTGASWAANERGITATNVLDFSAEPASKRIYAVAANKGVYYLDVGADSTTAVNNTTLAQLAAPAINSSPQAVLALPTQLLTSLTTGIAQSVDGGATWTLLPTPLQAAAQVTVFASSPASPQTILAGTLSGPWRSTDGGKNWTAVNTGLPGSSAIGEIWIAPSDPAIVYTAPYLAGQPTSRFYGVFRSNDGGQTWSAANMGISSNPIASLAVDPTRPQLVYAASGPSLLTSSNGGASWSTLAVDPTLGYPRAIAVDSSRPQTLYMAGSASLARSVDGGASWQTVRPENKFPSWSTNALIVDPARPGNVLVATSTVGIQKMTLAPDLALEVIAPNGGAAIAIPFNFTYSAVNNGPFDATGVQVAMQLPSGTQNVAATAASGTCSVSGTAATCTLPVLRTNEISTITLTATAAAAGSLQVSASIAGDQPDSDPSNNSVSSATQIAAPPPDNGGGSTGGTGSATKGGGGGAISPFMLLALAMFLTAQLVGKQWENIRETVNRRDIGC